MKLRCLFYCLWVALMIDATAHAQSNLLRDRKPSNDILLPRNPSDGPPPPEIDSKVKEFFMALQNGNALAAYQGILKESDMEDKETKARDLASKIDAMQKEFGQLNGFELYDNRGFGNRIRTLTYFSYHQQRPLRWRFIFYAGTVSQWRVINLSVDDLVIETLYQ